LFFEGGDVGQAIRAICDGNGQMGEDDTGIMGVPVDPTALHGHRHGLGQTAAIGQFSQEGGTGMGHEILAVGYHFGATDRASTVHF